MVESEATVEELKVFDESIPKVSLHARPGMQNVETVCSEFILGESKDNARGAKIGDGHDEVDAFEALQSTLESCHSEVSTLGVL